NGSLDGFAKLRPRYRERVNVYVVCVERQPISVFSEALVFDCNQNEIDIRLRPHFIVRKTAAKNGGQNGSVELHLLDQPTQRQLEFFLNRLLRHAVSTLSRIDFPLFMYRASTVVFKGQQ